MWLYKKIVSLFILKFNNMKINTKWFILVLCAFLSLNLYAGDKKSFLKKQFTSESGYKLNYRILYPLNYSPDKQYPVILFLHGAGERGNDNEKQLFHGGDMLSAYENRVKYPAIVIAPQTPKGERWMPINNEWSKFPEHAPMTPSLRSVKELLDCFIAKGMVDTKRIYVTGLSMGGMGTYDIVCRYPNFFAAAAPICGGVNLNRIAKFEGKTVFSIYHGGIDPVVPTDFSRDVFSILKKNKVEVRYKEYPGVKHNSWVNAFAEPDFLKWLFDHSL